MAQKSKRKNKGEFELIRRFQSLLTTRHPSVKVGIGDDCAVLAGPSRTRQLLSTDALIEGVHFSLGFHPPLLLGRKTIAVNLSDIAAMGGRPVLVLLSLGIPKSLPESFLVEFYKGVNQICKQFGVEVAGGDTVKSPGQFIINVTVLGQMNREPFTRDRAQPGDNIFVTGTLGDSAAGLTILKKPNVKRPITDQQKRHLVKRHLDPTPRIEVAEKIARSRFRINAMIDISDGLSQDLGHVLDASGVGARIHESRLPKSKALEKLVAGDSNLLRKMMLGRG